MTLVLRDPRTEAPRAPGCWPHKRQYPTRFAADKALKALSYQFRYRDPTLGVYQCGDHWHLGRREREE